MPSVSFIYNGNSFDVECMQVPCNVKLYSVPKNYSDDGLFVSAWSNDEIEQIPACAIGNETLLAHLQIAQNNNDCNEIFIAEGVQYAHN